MIVKSVTMFILGVASVISKVLPNIFELDDTLLKFKWFKNSTTSLKLNIVVKTVLIPSNIFDFAIL